jgi:predicted O-methyltransferase YrrM
MKHDHIFGWSSPELQGKLLEFILDTMKPKKHIVMAEIGVYLGRGTAIFDEVFVSRGQNYKLIAVDHFEGSREHKASSSVPSYEAFQQNIAPICDQIKAHNCDSIAASKLFKQGEFDIVYIDASHEYENVLADIKAWFPKVKKGGFICGDDFSNDWPGVVRAVNEHFGGKHDVVPGTQQWYFKK